MTKAEHPFKIVCAGDNCIDYYIRTDEAFYGGNPLNVAVYLAGLGAQPSYLGAVGTDEFGRGMLEALQERKIDISHVQILEGKTAITCITLEGNERILGEYEEGVMSQFTLRDQDFSFIEGQDLFISGLWGHTENQLARIQELGVPVAFDFADKEESEKALIALTHTDIAFFSDDSSDLDDLKEKLKRLSGLGPSLVIATRGEKGSLAYDGNRFEQYGIIPCEVIDTMGAGDSYIAGFLYARLQRKSLRDCMAAGAAKSAQTLGSRAAW